MNDTQTAPLPEGTRVYSTVARENATVVASMLIGKRNPGYVYTIRCDSGRMLHTPTGLLRVIA